MFRFVSESRASARTAIVADEGDSLWLYLTEAGGSAIVADCWLFNLVPAPPVAEFARRKAAYRERGEPPPATEDVVDDEAQLQGELDPSRVRVVWGEDGNSVTAWVDGQRAGFIAAGERRGYSAHLVAECPWGRPLAPSPE